MDTVQTSVTSEKIYPYIIVLVYGLLEFRYITSTSPLQRQILLSRSLVVGTRNRSTMAEGGDNKACDEFHTGDDDYSSSLFQCCVCLDLLYKPIVLSCGHISCFWCVHSAMQIVQESHCAVCRQAYSHFPSICQLLHLLLLKLEPVAYKRREREVLEDEKNRHIESPQFIDQVPLPNSAAKNSSSTTDSSAGTSTNKPEATENGSAHGVPKKISVEDVLCCLCNELLYLPSVLNCGHVYCEACLSSMARERVECKVCGAPHPGQFPNVCLDLDHFLEENFPDEYASRRQSAMVKKSQHQHGNASSSSAQGSGKSKKKADSNLFLGEERYDIHVGVGCDCCGLYPIKGKRYKCKDCTERIGYDLCESCYNTNSKLPGRFNQQHTSDHRFELDNTTLLSRILLQTAVAENHEEEFNEEEFADQDDGNEGHFDQFEDI
ncbi:hypothetical protein LUZ61_019262 [Rhynchospora tenuis]|uniref:E3 ubiquitin-protein ligase PRT1 n=1 Tax=Rhynchospora tenuis TaxID=198213 RepID=A0AAD5ZAW1_9POAL|nr:hypothetical protein LUZ61_019262 [Rhynchospora tenuis]